MQIFFVRNYFFTPFGPLFARVETPKIFHFSRLEMYFYTYLLVIQKIFEKILKIFLDKKPK